MRLILGTALLLLTSAPEPPLRFETTATGPQLVARLPAEFVAKMPAGVLTQEQGEAILTLSLLADSTRTPGTSILGKYERSGNRLTFTPRFPLRPGATYRATLKTAGKSETLDFAVPTPAAKSPPRVVKILPSADVLPASLLRFYIYFDRPMRGGKELFEHLAILDDKGKEVEEPWLVDEIWDEEHHCLILFIHPGRIKWGVELRDLMGPVLYEKRSYTLVVRGNWTDLEGNRLGKDVTKRFRTTPEDRARIELGDWKLTAPRAGTREALTLTLSKCLDYRSLQTGLTVADASGQILTGAITIGKDEKSWRFTPGRPWQAAPHRVTVNADAEDVAGNTPSRPFDVDLLAPPRPAQKLHFDFEPR
jgi:hypothetical protein